MIVMGMVAPRGDGKPSNVLLELRGNSKKRVVHIDNDQDLIVDSVVDEGILKSTSVKAKNILFCLPEMCEEVHFATRKKFLSLDIDQVLRIWSSALVLLDERNTSLFAPAERAFFFDRYKKQDVRVGSVIQMLFHPRTAEFVYERLAAIKRIFSEDKSLTHLALLKSLDPVLAKMHEVQLSDNKSSPTSRFLQIEQNQYEKIVGTQRLGTTLKTNTTLQSRLKKVPKKLEEEIAMHATSLAASLAIVIEMNAKRAQVKLAILTGKSLPPCPDYFLEEVFNSLLSHALEEEQKQFILKAIRSSKIKFRYLQIGPQSKVGEKDFELILRSCTGVSQIDLEGFPAISDHCVSCLFRMCKNLNKLSLKSLRSDSFTKFPRINFEGLSFIEVNGCNFLKSFAVPPNVEKCTFKGNLKLEEVHFLPPCKSSVVVFKRNEKLYSIFGLLLTKIRKLRFIGCPSLEIPDLKQAGEVKTEIVKEIFGWYRSNREFWSQAVKEMKRKREDEKAKMTKMVGLTPEQCTKLLDFLSNVKRCVNCRKNYLDIFNSTNSATCYYHSKEWEQKNGRYPYGYYPCCHARNQNATGWFETNFIFCQFLCQTF